MLFFHASERNCRTVLHFCAPPYAERSPILGLCSSRRPWPRQAACSLLHCLAAVRERKKTDTVLYSHGKFSSYLLPLQVSATCICTPESIFFATNFSAFNSELSLQAVECVCACTRREHSPPVHFLGGGWVQPSLSTAQRCLLRKSVIFFKTKKFSGVHL